MGSWWSFCSRRSGVVILWRGSPIGVKLMMSSSAPPPRADRACTHLGASVLNDAWNYCSRMTEKMLGLKLSQGEEPQSHLTHCFCSKLEVKESPSIVDELPQSVG